MSNENGWIPWDERKDVQKYVVVEYSMGLDYNDTPIEIYDYFYLGNIPNEYIEEFKKDVEEERDYFLRSIEQLNEQEINQALRFFVLHKDDKEGAGVYFWNLKRTYEKADKFKYELFCNNNQSTLESVPDVSDSPAVPASASADNDSPADKTVKSELTQKKKCGRPTKKEEEKICFAIIGLFDSPKKNQIINSIKTLGNVVKKINRRLKDSGIEIDERRLDGDKIPGRLFRYLWYYHTKIFAWGYREQNIEMDKDLIQEYLKKYSKYREYLEK